MKTAMHPALASGLVAITLLAGTPAAENRYILHEWGTFTTVIGSDGSHLDGVHREDAPLPEFVYALDALPTPAPVAHPHTKGLTFTRKFAGVNVRLETPVIYFYTDQVFDAQVDVRFKNGTIGQWYPDRSAGELRHPDGPLNFAQARTGSIRWDVRVEPPGEDASARVFRSGELPCWLYPRYPDSALVTNAKGETEKYLFYRGLGRMTLPVVFSASDQELHAHNRGSDPIAQWLVFDHDREGRARWWTPGALDSDDGKATVSLEGKDYRSDWKSALYQEGIEMLEAAGLFRKEADAMMQTWWSNYFETAGLRVFWIVPRPTVDEILPLDVSPAPAEVERVIVGRCEVLKPSFEQQLVSDFASVGGKEEGNPWAGDRFFPAYANRVKQLNRSAPTTQPVGSAAVLSPPQTWVGEHQAIKLPAGQWRVHFTNGIVQTCDILTTGEVTVAQAGRTADGHATVKGRAIVIHYEDDRTERWIPQGESLRVEHWHPGSTMGESEPVIGTAIALVGATETLGSTRSTR